MSSNTQDQQIACIKDLKRAGSEKLSQSYQDYYNGGAMDELTLDWNETAFNKYLLRPRVLRNVENIDMSTTLWGKKAAVPFGLAPSAMHRLIHADGEIGTSKAAAARNVPMVLSLLSNDSLEDVAAQRTDGPTPYGIHISPLNKREVLSNLLIRAKAAGYNAVILTVDAPMYGRRLADERNNWSIIPPGATFPNVAAQHVKPSEISVSASETWEEFIPWVRSQTDLELWVKGVTSKEDVENAIKHGVDGIIISNNGGRQLDTTPATIDILRKVAPIAKGRIPLALDGGVYRGSDIFKAIALGADFVFGGRIAICGLAYNGSAGVGLGLDIIIKEFKSCMGLTGCTKVSDIGPHHLSILQSNGLLGSVY
ncbi:Non-canonical non-ribosomal peptide synthetase fub8 [Trichoderma asperellum]|uniref:FMN hydroxy acid dehydrogenase domain-containing protein n=1 Tax=Trichoderma asperellum (strain ATCC 204424 / CBS 433.97 / NBRC 101777) TaxID=1042311 RepID=A0A2T3ZMB8_TRIA4|nr:hypothetical protein M441DRAFT_63251 [Trichoderma asperellum CBS 433.97]PTB45932.1 hypothetical protein M441DRAFT_63251 [Trichoderma asperellum CBS 433.97]UKZ88854.1 Non-canonical non-ribosomal peptide synthetase fub8 [Trichoderma asperellum]